MYQILPRIHNIIFWVALFAVVLIFIFEVCMLRTCLNTFVVYLLYVHDTESKLGFVTSLLIVWLGMLNCLPQTHGYTRFGEHICLCLVRDNIGYYNVILAFCNQTSRQLLRSRQEKCQIRQAYETQDMSQQNKKCTLTFTIRMTIVVIHISLL